MSTHQQTPEELCRAIDSTRRELGATVEQLAAKTAVKARLHDAAEHLVGELKRTLERPPVQAAAIGGVGIALLMGWTQLRRSE